MNKSQEIRDFVSANPTASAKDVVEALKRTGIKVSAPMVANVKSKAGLTRSRRGRPPGKTTPKVGRPAKKGGDVALDALLDAKRLIAKCGSAQAAVDMIRTLEKLDSISN